MEFNSIRLKFETGSTSTADRDWGGVEWCDCNTQHKASGIEWSAQSSQQKRHKKRVSFQSHWFDLIECGKGIWYILNLKCSDFSCCNLSDILPISNHPHFTHFCVLLSLSFLCCTVWKCREIPFRQVERSSFRYHAWLLADSDSTAPRAQTLSWQWDR